MKNILATIISVFLFSSCKTELNKEEYLTYMKNERDNFVKTENMGDQQYIFVYKPTELVAIEQCETESVDNKCDMKTLIDENKKFEYLNLIIKDQDSKGSIHRLFKDNDLYREKLEYMTSDMKQDFLLIEDNDTLPCVLYNFEPPFTASSELRFALGFEKKHISDNKTMQILFNDKILGRGIIKCNYNWSLMKSLPSLIVD